MNPATKTLVLSSVGGAGIWGAKRLGWLKDDTALQESVASTLHAAKRGIEGLVQTSFCATAAGWFQTYSGGIVIDTVATRLQSGQSMSQALWGLRHPNASARDIVRRHRMRVRSKWGPAATPATYEVYVGMLIRSDLFAGHFVTMLGRFPYLFLNFSTYQQTENLLLSGILPTIPGVSGGVITVRRRHVSEKTLPDELVCVSAATVISTGAITIAECPKVIDQVGSSSCTAASGNRSTVTGILREHGIRRLLRGYTACFLREYLFNAALLMSPSLAARIHESHVRGRDGTLAWALRGREIVVASLLLGLPLGLLTNGPDQLKTNIQAGTFLNMR